VDEDTADAGEAVGRGDGGRGGVEEGGRVESSKRGLKVAQGGQQSITVRIPGGVIGSGYRRPLGYLRVLSAQEADAPERPHRHVRDDLADGAFVGRGLPGCFRRRHPVQRLRHGRYPVTGLRDMLSHVYQTQYDFLVHRPAFLACPANAIRFRLVRYRHTLSTTLLLELRVSSLPPVEFATLGYIYVSGRGSCRDVVFVYRRLLVEDRIMRLPVVEIVLHRVMAILLATVLGLVM
jgi:hypothetical protein